MSRAYSPRMSTTLLMAAILARPGIATVRPIAPTRTRGTLLRVTLDGPGNVYTDFTLPEARAWLAADTEGDTR